MDPINYEYKVKYIDFGLSKILLPGEVSMDRYGTLAYCSPEIVLGHSHTCQTDVWSLGVIYHMLLSGMLPFISRDQP
jgi:serine/threonine protein kinase